MGRYLGFNESDVRFSLVSHQHSSEWININLVLEVNENDTSYFHYRIFQGGLSGFSPLSS